MDLRIPFITMVILKHACPSCNCIAKLVHLLYCSIIYHADCNSGPFCTFKWTFLCSLEDLFVHSSGPFGGPFSDWGGGGGGFFQSPENPPWLRPCLSIAAWEWLHKQMWNLRSESVNKRPFNSSHFTERCCTVLSYHAHIGSNRPSISGTVPKD